MLMSNDKLAKTIDEAFEGRDKITPKTKGAVRKAVDTALGLLDSGQARVAERGADGNWQVHQWLKKAVLLSFRLNDMSVIPGGPGKAVWWDKVDSKFKGWTAARFRKEGFRAVPGSVVRKSAYIAPGVILMPSFVNLGARSEVVEGVIVGECSVLSMGVFISASTKIIDRNTCEVFVGRVPPYSVVAAGTRPGKPFPNGEPGPNLYCAVIVKRVDEKTRSKTSITDLLRD
jgi:2,3,4,5-tetrahydropyridine-2-carboxylate N-succinyltransferase